MNAARACGYDLDRLIDSHIELCERFYGRKTLARYEAPMLVTMRGGKTITECLVELVDLALVASEVSGYVEDDTVFAMKSALVEAIMRQT